MEKDKADNAELVEPKRDLGAEPAIMTHNKFDVNPETAEVSPPAGTPNVVPNAPKRKKRRAEKRPNTINPKLLDFVCKATEGFLEKETEDIVDNSLPSTSAGTLSELRVCNTSRLFPENSSDVLQQESTQQSKVPHSISQQRHKKIRCKRRRVEIVGADGQLRSVSKFTISEELSRGPSDRSGSGSDSSCSTIGTESDEELKSALAEYEKNKT